MIGVGPFRPHGFYSIPFCSIPFVLVTASEESGASPDAHIVPGQAQDRLTPATAPPAAPTEHLRKHPSHCLVSSVTPGAGSPCRGLGLHAEPLETSVPTCCFQGELLQLQHQPRAKEKARSLSALNEKIHTW